MRYDKTVETCCGYRGHTEKHKQAFSQRVEFALKAWILIAEYKDNDQYRRKTECNRETGPEDYQVYRHQWSHQLVSNTV